MKNIMIICLALALALAISFTTAIAGENGKEPHRVAICHYAGHDGDFVVTGKGCGCKFLGGRVIIVDLNACLNGHKVAGGAPWKPWETCQSAVGGYGNLWDPKACGPCPCWFDEWMGCAGPCVNLPRP